MIRDPVGPAVPLTEQNDFLHRRSQRLLHDFDGGSDLLDSYIIGGRDGGVNRRVNLTTVRRHLFRPGMRIMG